MARCNRVSPPVVAKLSSRKKVLADADLLLELFIEPI